MDSYTSKNIAQALKDCLSCHPIIYEYSIAAPLLRFPPTTHEYCLHEGSGDMALRKILILDIAPEAIFRPNMSSTHAGSIHDLCCRRKSQQWCSYEILLDGMKDNLLTPEQGFCWYSWSLLVPASLHTRMQLL